MTVYIKCSSCRFTAGPFSDVNTASDVIAAHRTKGDCHQGYYFNPLVAALKVAEWDKCDVCQKPIYICTCRGESANG